MPTLEEVYGAPPEVKPTDVFGSKPATLVDKSSLAGISLSDMGISPDTPAATQADEGFFTRSGRAIKDFEVGSFQHPIQNLLGVAKGLTAGAVTMGELGAKGLAGLVTATVGKGFDAGPQAVDAWLEADRNASKGILYINLAPSNRQEEAFQNFLGIIPDAIVSTGDTVYEKTGSALAGAGAQALLTLLSMKPSAAGKVLKGPLKLAKGEPLSPAGKMGAEKVQMAFDELAVKDPQGATALAEHIIEADPETGFHLMKSIDDAGKVSPEELGKKAAQVDKVSEPELPAPPEGSTRVWTKDNISHTTDKASLADPVSKAYGGTLSYLDVPTSDLAQYSLEKGAAKPTRFSLPPELTKDSKTVTTQFAPEESIRKSAQELHEALVENEVPVDEFKIGEVARAAQNKLANDAAIREARAQERAYVKANLKHTSEDGSHSVDSLNGTTDAIESGPYLKVKFTATEPKAQGTGEGTLRIEKLVEVAKERDLKLSSDVTVSASQTRVYESLKKRGYKVKENPNTINPETGSKISNDPRVPVYEVAPKPYKPWNKKGPVYKPASPVLYTDAGHPVTRASVEAAFRFGSQLSNLPGVRLLTGKLSEYYRQLVQTVNPEALGPEAKTAASILAKHIAKQMQRDSSQFHRAQERVSFWNHQTPEATRAFIKGFEKGEKFSDPVLQKAADGYRRWNDEIYQQEKKLGFDYEPIDNYLYHVFEDSPGVAEFFQKRFGPKWNNPSFIKDRSFDLYAAAVEAGYKPRFTNPEDIMLARQHASNIAEMRVNALQELKNVGLATESGQGKAPSGWPATEWRSPTGERYWVHDSASAVLRNAFETQSLWNLKGIAGDAFRSAMFLKNTIVPIKLALSLFHPLHVLTIDNATGMVRATKELLSGTKSPQSFIADMAKSTLYADIYSSPRSGYHLLNAYKGKLPDSAFTPSDTLALQYMAEGGFIPEMSSQYRLGAIAKFKSAVQRRSLASAWHLPFAAIESLQRPMFEVWIPSLKIASYLKDVQTAIKTDPTLLDNPTKRQVAFRKISKSVDNRYGEMAYNTLFWNRWVKDLAVANTLSLGWQMGFIREYGGGMLDIGQLATTKGGFREKVSTGRLDRPLFVSYYTAQALAYGGLMTWALTGQGPQDLSDYIYPQTGEAQPNGKPERVNTMFYPREFASIYKHMENEGVVSGLGHLASSKASGVLGMTREWATGINSFDQEIRDPDAPAYKQLEQTLASTLVGLQPISVKTIGESESPNRVKAIALSIAGFGPAPKYVTESKTEGLIKGTFKKYFSQRLTPFEKAEASNERRALKKAFDNGDGDAYATALDTLREKFQLSGKEQRTLERKIARGVDAQPLSDMFKRLTWQQQKKILDQMTPEEREAYMPYTNKEHLRFSYEPPEEKH